MKKMLLIAPVCVSFAAHSDESIDESSFATSIKAMQDQMAQFKDKMNKKDETIAALKAKMEHRQVQMTAGGEVMQLVSEADLKELAARVAACEKTNADQDAKLGMTMDTLSKVRKEIKDGHVGAPPALPSSPPPPLPPPRPVAKPGRQLSSSSDGNFVNELSITGSNAVVSWNSHTPGLTPFNCTGVGDGRLTCSGTVRAEDFITSDGYSLTDVVERLGVYRPSNPPPSPPPPPLLTILPVATLCSSSGCSLVPSADDCRNWATHQGINVGMDWSHQANAGSNPGCFIYRGNRLFYNDNLATTNVWGDVESICLCNGLNG